MKRLSRLTALLLALMLLVCSAAQADVGIQQEDLDLAGYNDLLTGVQTYGLADGGYEYYISQLSGLDTAARYAKLVEWHGSWLGTIFYAGFVGYYKTAYPGGDLICTCAAPIEYGSLNHAAACGWAFANLTMAEQYAVMENLGAEEKESYAAALPAETAERLARVNAAAYTAAADAASVAISVPDGAFASDYILEAAATELTDALLSAVTAAGEDAQALAAFDISFPKLADESVKQQPAADAPVSLTFTVPTAQVPETANYLSVYHMADNGDGTYTAEAVGELVAVDRTLENQTLPVAGSAFSIYVVVGTYSNNWNYNNYKIVMTVGDSLQVSTSTTGNSYAWSIASGDAGSFTLANNNQQTATITANATGTVTLQCVIAPRRGSATTETMTVVALASVGSSVDDDIIFARVNKNFSVGDTEYENTYGPYVMKIRFEDGSIDDPENNLLEDMGQEYYVFDSECDIDINTFAATAPDGYTYAGAFFYWSDHDAYDGAKVYVTSVERDNSNTATGSHLWYSGDHDTLGNGRWTYQASGVLHVVYMPVDEVHTIIFKDHCGYELANYALAHNDRGVTFPSGYVGNIDNMANTLISNHHATHDAGYEFEGTWVVTGGGNRIDGTYTTAELKSAITGWNITSNITITAQCSEPDVTINYVAVKPEGLADGIDFGSVKPTSETVKVSSETAQGSTATAVTGYKFVGWYSDEACTTLLSADAKYVPQKVDGKNVAATYYAKFDYDLTSLTIKKTGVSAADAGASFVFNVKGGETDLDVVIYGEGSVTIQDLKVGTTYTVTEKSGSFRYYPLPAAQSITLKASGNALTFENKRSEDQWLDSDTSAENNFNAVTE